MANPVATDKRGTLLRGEDVTFPSDARFLMRPERFPSYEPEVHEPARKASQI